MLAPRGGPSLMELDRQASTENQPHLMITADCSKPRELDDGLIVEPLPSAQEMYRVGVCVVDASMLYRDSNVMNEAMRRTEAKYYPLTGEEQGYEPMVPEEAIEDYDFKIRKPGDVRAAMIVRFVIGENQPPTDTEVVFGQVEVAANHNYRDFASQCRTGQQYERFNRAASFIKSHLAFTSGGDHDAEQEGRNAVRKREVDPVLQGFIRGSRINEAFMVGACRQVGQLLIPETDRIGIYRVHDPEDDAHRMFLPANVATYSWEPGPHDGLGLFGYCRVTSPLRRVEDLIMSHLLRERYEGMPVTRNDEDMVALAVHRLNGRIMQEYASKPLKHMKGQALLGRNRRLIGSMAGNSAAVVPLRPASAQAASA